MQSLVLIILLILIQTTFAFINPGGYYGYSYTPTPTSIDLGELGYAARFGFVGNRDISHSVAMRPLSFIELGLGISRNPVPAAKIILPFYDELGQGVALGFSGKRWYFTGMLQSVSESKKSYNLTLAGIYDINLHSSVGSLAGEADFGSAALSVENFWYLNRYGAAATFSLRPLAVFALPSYFEANAGVAWHSPEHSNKEIYAYTAVQVHAPLLQTEKEPFIYIDINPAFDHSVSFVEDVYPMRFALDIDAVLAISFDFFFVGALSPSVETEKTNRLPKRDLLDRYYLLWDSEKFPIWAACGMLNTDIYGCQTQATKMFYNTFGVTLGYTEGDQKGINATGQIPLHPRFSGFLSNSLLFAEGGLFLGENLAAQLNLRQGTDKKHLQIGSGYDFERKNIFGEISFQYDFSISKQVSGVAIRLAPNLRHRENSIFYSYEYDVPIYQEGNNARRLHNFPWKK
jgi:hypothetical protein